MGCVSLLTYLVTFSQGALRKRGGDCGPARLQGSSSSQGKPEEVWALASAIRLDGKETKELAALQNVA